MTSRVLYARHRLDIRPRHLAKAVVALSATGRDQAARDLERLWSPDGAGLACYSVRSGFHLFLSALGLPPASEVLFSAVTHPDMPRIAQHHGLVPVPVDLDPDTLAPSPHLLRRAITGRSRLLVVAHLFGGRIDLYPLAAICRENRLLLVEDCAQAYRGPVFTGAAAADISMFSFGILKTSTALGGALLTVRDPRVLHLMRWRQAGWPEQTGRSHMRRIAQTAAFMALTRPLPMALVARAAGFLHRDFDDLVNTAGHAFPTGPTGELVRRLEMQPGAPLLRLMEHRLRTFDASRLQARAASGERLAGLLPRGLHLGDCAPDRTHWLFPVVAANPDAMIGRARALGFDAARSASSVRAIPAPPGRPHLDPGRARKAMANLVFLPAYPELPDGSLEKLAAALDGDDGHARSQI